MPGTSRSFTPSSEPDGMALNDSPKTRKPDNTAFKQQRLPAWQPILTARSVLPGFFVISAIFIPIGIVLLVASDDIVEVSHDYTRCETATSSSCADFRNNNSVSTMSENCTCTFNLEVKKAMPGEVFVYYGLTNFFQNHRRYVKSRDDVQLNGQSVTASSINTDCKPYDKPNSSSSEYYAPAGAIANSLFNDTFMMRRSGTPSTEYLTVNRTNIAWPTDSAQKFNNPPGENPFADTVKPKYWQVSVNELDPDNPQNNGYENEGLIVWMRTAAFPTFRKPYGRITGGLLIGNYTVTVNYNFPVVAYGGTKRFILSTTSWIGGKNIFLGVGYIVVGSFCFITAVALCVIDRMTKKKSARSLAH